MKKALLIVALLTGTGRLMAQNDLKLPEQVPSPVFQIRVDTTINSPSLKDLTKLPDANILKKLSTLENFNQTPLTQTKLIGHMEGYLMPVAVLGGKSKMPVKKIDGFYTMPVVGQDFNKKNGVTLIHP
ncbi:hypothetical protein IDJ77_16150 [Mucilaginibacter sp. ZT4R22]|uniref:Uncharacterized protein n=1 Tax=Mucilaginibacter pankratovii TaxID=2772110 RepID=A0ABR7WSR2_9SPHI|nr:hypothetical protein [Mucilaginibacter pankratovii]MBD1365349.1 hypothetical protein [Mucilaginibacter pankratovii]